MHSLVNEILLLSEDINALLHESHADRLAWLILLVAFIKTDSDVPRMMIRTMIVPKVARKFFPPRGS